MFICFNEFPRIADLIAMALSRSTLLTLTFILPQVVAFSGFIPIGKFEIIVFVLLILYSCVNSLLQS